VQTGVGPSGEKEDAAFAALLKARVERGNREFKKPAASAELLIAAALREDQGAFSKAVRNLGIVAASLLLAQQLASGKHTQVSEMAADQVAEDGRAPETQVSEFAPDWQEPIPDVTETQDTPDTKPQEETQMFEFAPTWDGGGKEPPRK
jgi:hypothetical protein